MNGEISNLKVSHKSCIKIDRPRVHFSLQELSGFRPIIVHFDENERSVRLKTVHFGPGSFIKKLLQENLDFHNI